jgi:uncharacterized protein
MRLPFLSMFVTSPFDAIYEHAEKVKECSWAFQQAIECFSSTVCESFEEHRLEVLRFEQEADTIKQRIRDQLPRGAVLPVERFLLLRYLREEDSVLDSVLEAVNWLSLRTEMGLPAYIEKDFFLLVDAAIEPIEELAAMVAEARIYFKNFSGKQRKKVNESIRKLIQMDHEVDRRKYSMVKLIFKNEKDPILLFHLVKLSEIIGSIADHAENSGELMRAMMVR